MSFFTNMIYAVVQAESINQWVICWVLGTFRWVNKTLQKTLQITTCLTGHVAICGVKTIGRVYLLHAANWPRV
jgi:hypothetical protein